MLVYRIRCSYTGWGVCIQDGRLVGWYIGWGVRFQDGVLVYRMG